MLYKFPQSNDASILCVTPVYVRFYVISRSFHQFVSDFFYRKFNNVYILFAFTSKKKREIVSLQNTVVLFSWHHVELVLFIDDTHSQWEQSGNNAANKEKKRNSRLMTLFLYFGLFFSSKQHCLHFSMNTFLLGETERSLVLAILFSLMNSLSGVGNWKIAKKTKLSNVVHAHMPQSSAIKKKIKKIKKCSQMRRHAKTPK